MWKVVRENPRAVVYAVLMHLVLLVLLMFSLDWTPTATKPGGTRPIQAELVDHKQLKAIEDRKLAEQRKIEQDAKKKAEAFSRAEDFSSRTMAEKLIGIYEKIIENHGTKNK